MNIRAKITVNNTFYFKHSEFEQEEFSVQYSNIDMYINIDN